MPVPSNIYYLPLFQRLMLSTGGIALTKSTLDLNIPQVRNALSQAAGIFIIGLTEAPVSTDFEWNVAFYSGFDRDHQQTAPIDINAVNFSAVLPQGQRSVEYTTTTNFLPESRLQLWWRNPTGISGSKSAVVSGILGIRLST